MKKLALITALLLSTTAFADGHHEYREYRGYENHYHHTHGDSFGGFIGPALIGGIIGYEIGRPSQPTVIYPAPPVVVQQAQPVYVYPTNVPVPAGMYCELRSVNYNGQIVTNNYCHY